MRDRLIYRFFSDDDFLRISKKITESEKKTSGEIRIGIREKKGWLSRGKDIRALAEKEFYKLNMHTTRDKTGILLFLLLSEKKFYILADEGINSKVDQKVWDEIRDQIQVKFKIGNYTLGLIEAIEKIGNILNKHFPIKSDDTNELSNRIAVN